MIGKLMVRELLGVNGDGVLGEGGTVGAKGNGVTGSALLRRS